MIETIDLHWRANARGCFTLHLHGRGPALVEAVRDVVHPHMWRVRTGSGRITDMVNISRALDAGIAITLGMLNDKKEYREIRGEAPPARFSGPPHVQAQGKSGERASAEAAS
jgi:hypothetical protein